MKTRIRELELQNLALKTLIEVAERNGIEIRKKNGGQAVEDLHRQYCLTIIAACELLGHSRHAFYKKKTDGVGKLATERKILDAIPRSER